MVVKPRLLIPHMPDDICELSENILIILPVMKFCLIFHIEGLRHVHAVQPYLIRINFLVPEISLCRAWLVLYLTVDPFYRAAVLFLSVQSV